MIQPQANKWILLSSEILKRTLKTLGELPDRNFKRLLHILKKCEDVILDGTESPIQHPVDEDKQSVCYSGKKTHSIKNNLFCTGTLRIVWLSSTYEDHVYDKKYVMKSRFCFLRELDFGRISVSSDTGLMVSKYVCSRRNLTEKNLPLMKSKRIGGFRELELKLSVYR